MKKHLSKFIIIFLLLIIPWSQNQSDRTRKKIEGNILKDNQILAPKIVRPNLLPKLSLGFAQFSADLIWLEMIQYFGGGNFQEKYDVLADLLDSVVLTDPKFEYPYLFSILVLPNQGDLDRAIIIGERGLKNLPESSLIPYYLASVYYQKKEYIRAAELYQLAAKNPKTPPAAKVLAGVSLSQLSDKQAALLWWQGILESNPKGSFAAERATVWLEHLTIMLNLESKAQEFKKIYGYFPKDLDEMINKGVLEEKPKSLLSFEYVLDPKTGQVSVQSN